MLEMANLLVPEEDRVDLSITDPALAPGGGMHLPVAWQTFSYRC